LLALYERPRRVSAIWSATILATLVYLAFAEYSKVKLAAGSAVLMAKHVLGVTGTGKINLDCAVDRNHVVVFGRSTRDDLHISSLDHSVGGLGCCNEPNCLDQSKSVLPVLALLLPRRLLFGLAPLAALPLPFVRLSRLSLRRLQAG
jgi:hypothetical protein